MYSHILLLFLAMPVYLPLNMKLCFGLRVGSFLLISCSLILVNNLCLDTCCSVTGTARLSLPCVFGRTVCLPLTNSLTVGKSWPVLGPVWQIPPCDRRRQIPSISDNSGVRVRFLPSRTHNTHTHILTPKPQCPISLPVLCSGLVAQSGSTQLPVISGCSTEP